MKVDKDREAFPVDSLIKSKLALEKAQEIGKFGHWELELESGKLHWSKQIYSIFRLSPDEFKPTYENFLAAIHPDDRELVDTAYKDSLKNKTPYQVEHRLLFKDGSIAYVYERCETHYDVEGNPVRSMGTVQDITERVMAEQKIRESEEKFKAYSKQSSEGVTVADMDGNYIFVNPAFCKMSGYSEEELLKLTVFDMKALNQDHGSFAESKEKSVGKPIRVNLKRKDGTEYLTEIIGDVIMVNGQKQVLGTIRDITQQVKDEEEIRKLNDNLEQIVKERTNELDETIKNLKGEVEKRINFEKQIQESLHIKEVLLKEITHRVKNNLQIISSLLNLQKGSIDNEESIDLLDQTVNRIQSMALIHETLYSSKEFEQININTYVKLLIEYVNKALDSANIDFAIKVDEITLSIDSATSCGMIIMELITNSIKYAFYDVNNPCIEVNIEKIDKDRFKLVVADNGVGFPNDIDIKTAKSLGMQIIVSLVEQYEGSISLNREIPGTHFEIIIKDHKIKGLKID